MPQPTAYWLEIMHSGLLSYSFAMSDGCCQKFYEERTNKQTNMQVNNVSTLLVARLVKINKSVIDCHLKRINKLIIMIPPVDKRPLLPIQSKG